MFPCGLGVCVRGRLQYLRIGLHELFVSTDKMSSLGTEETPCCSHHTDVKYNFEVIPHICFREVELLNGWCSTSDTS